MTVTYTGTFAPLLKSDVHLSVFHLDVLAAARVRGWVPDGTNEFEVIPTRELIEWGFLTARYNLTKAGRLALVDRNWK